GEDVKEYATPLKGIEQWQIHLTPDGPLGYGKGGVYALDEHLCPAAKLIGLRGADADRPFDVSLLASDGRTLGLLGWDRGVYVLQIWTRDGKRKIREQEVLPPGYLRGHTGRLIPLAGGYLLSGGEVLWVPAAADRRVWRFNFGESPEKNLPRLYNAL